MFLIVHLESFDNPQELSQFLKNTWFGRGKYGIIRIRVNLRFLFLIRRTYIFTYLSAKYFKRARDQSIQKYAIRHCHPGMMETCLSSRIYSGSRGGLGHAKAHLVHLRYSLLFAARCTASV